MKTITFLSFGALLALAAPVTGCAEDESLGTGEDEATGTFADPGPNLGRATMILADTDGTGVFAIYDRNLERRTTAGVEALGRLPTNVDPPVVSAKFFAFTRTLYSGETRLVELHWLDRTKAFAEVRVDTFELPPASHGPKLAVLDDDTIAIGFGSDIHVRKVDGEGEKLAGYATKFRADSVVDLLPGATTETLFARLDNDEVYEVTRKTNAVRFVGRMPAFRPLAFDRDSKTFVAVDFDEIRTYDTNGNALRSFTLQTAKSRYFTAFTVVGGAIVAANQTEKSQDRDVLATYDLGTLSRKEIATFGGSFSQMQAGAGQIFFAFAPQGADSIGGKVSYAHARRL